MSGIDNNQQGPNFTPDLDSDEVSAPLPTENSNDLSPRETPLPNFNPVSPDAETPQMPIKTSGATSPDLNNLFTGQTSEETLQAQQPVSGRVYKISPAEPNLSTHIMSSEDEPEPEEEEEEGPSGWQTTWAIVREVGETIILTLIIFFLIQLFVRNFRVVGTSMVNNLHDGQYLIIDKISYNQFITENIGIGGPKRGDVIVFKPPRNPGDDYVKRVIGLPGEKVQVIKGQVFINDQPLEEPFQPTPGSYTMHTPVIVPEGQIFVLGDNRNNSNDSHNWGPLPIENIVGRAWLSYWPPDQWGSIPRDVPTEEATLRHFVGQFIPAANAHNE